MGATRASTGRPRPFPVVHAVIAVVSAVALCIAGSLLSPLASLSPPGRTEPVADMRVFPDRNGFNVLILPFSDPRMPNEGGGDGLSRIEERLLRSLKDSAPAAGGRMDAEFLLPARMPFSVREARDIGARHGADFVVWAQGGMVGAAHVGDLPPAGARGPAGYAWSVPATLPRDPDCTARFILGAEAASGGFFDDGITLFEDAAEACGGRNGNAGGYARFHAASCAAAAGERREAIRNLAGALYTPGTAEAARRNMDILLAEHFAGFAERRVSYGPVEKRLPRSGAVVSDSTVNMLLDHHFQGSQGALRRYFQAVSLRLKPAEAHVALGEVLEVVFGDPAGAAGEYEKARRLAPSSFEPVYRWASITEHLPGGKKAAAEGLEAALEIRFDPWAAHNLAVLKENVFGDLAGAEKWYRKAHEARPDFFEPVRNLALLYKTRLNRPEKAREAFEAALALRPEDPEMNAEMGMLFLERFNDPERAAHRLRIALRNHPRPAGTHLVLALLLRDRLHDPGGARRHYLAAGRINPAFRTPASDRAFYVREPGAGSDDAFLTVRGKPVRFVAENPSTTGTGCLR